MQAEELAAKYLVRHGYQVLERNFRIRGGEIDIIAREKNTLVFVEVKARNSSTYGTPFEAITPWKLKALRKTALFYKQSHPRLPDLLRLDAISVSRGELGEPVFELIKNIG